MEGSIGEGMGSGAVSSIPDFVGQIGPLSNPYMACGL